MAFMVFSFSQGLVRPASPFPARSVRVPSLAGDRTGAIPIARELRRPCPVSRDRGYEILGLLSDRPRPFARCRSGVALGDGGRSLFQRGGAHQSLCPLSADQRASVFSVLRAVVGARRGGGFLSDVVRLSGLSRRVPDSVLSSAFAGALDQPARAQLAGRAVVRRSPSPLH